MKRFIYILCFLSSLCSCSPFEEELSDDAQDDLTYRLPWVGDVDKFKIDKKEGLRLDDEQKSAGSAFLATASSQVRRTRWEFRTHLLFNPSANNYARFYLSASNSNLSEALDGYFLKIGGAKDCVSLYRQNGSEVVLLAEGRELMRGHNSPNLKLKVECDDNGCWTFWTCLKGEPDYVLEKQVWDKTFTSSAYAGVLCFYTASRCNSFIFSHVSITYDVEASTNPELPDQPEQEPEQGPEQEPEQGIEGLLFNEVMYDCAKDGAEYVELYNNSPKTVLFSNIRLGKLREDGSYISKIALYTASPGALKVSPGGYICFTKSVGVLKKKHQYKKGVLAGISNFPALSNNGGILVLLSKDDNMNDKVIDRFRFSNTMHTGSKRSPGVSLEKRSPTLASNSAANWLSSQNQTGGTPGVQNFATNR